MWFNASEGIGLLRFDAALLLDLVLSVPERIRRGRLRLNGHYNEWYRKWEEKTLKIEDKLRDCET